MRGVRILARVAGAVVVAAVALPAAGSSPLHGPDVSSHQHPQGAAIDWSKVDGSGASFAFVKATEGSSYTNPYFASDYRKAREAGLVRSAYHYARPELDPASARDQADYFVGVAGTAGAKGDLPLTLDLEESGGLSPAQLIAWTHAFVDEVTALTSRPPILYTYPTFWQRAMADTTDFSDLPLWIASYRSGGPKSPLPGGWSSWTFWQYTANGRVAGIASVVDRSRFSGSAADLQQLADPNPPAPAPVPLITLPPLPSAPPVP